MYVLGPLSFPSTMIFILCWPLSSLLTIDSLIMDIFDLLRSFLLLDEDSPHSVVPEFYNSFIIGTIIIIIGCIHYHPLYESPGLCLLFYKQITLRQLSNYSNRNDVLLSYTEIDGWRSLGDLDQLLRLRYRCSTTVLKRASDHLFGESFWYLHSPAAHFAHSLLYHSPIGSFRCIFYSRFWLVETRTIFWGLVLFFLLWHRNVSRLFYECLL